MLAIETAGLTHRFSSDPVLSGVDLAVPAGGIYGFLGPNGAGKTTTLRLILGLLKRQQGTIEIFGQTLERHRLDLLRRIGSSIETPSLYGHLTAVENLEVWRRIFGCPRRRIAETLALVGLTGTGGTGSKRADQFSLGMRQRLAIAVALLHEPALLLLDEPTNGLDPHGILEMRRLLGALNRDHGITILVSSHLLSEVERLATHIGVIHRGTIRFQGTLDALRARQAAPCTVVQTSDDARAIEVASRLAFAGRIDNGRAVFDALAREDAGRLVAALVEHGLRVYEVATVRRDLEHIFLDLVGLDLIGDAS